MVDLVTYSQHLKEPSRILRNKMTFAEKRLWQKIRRKQINNVQFYRQKPVANFILDFYAKLPKIAIEIDGGIHYNDYSIEYDESRDAVLKEFGFQILHFSNEDILFDIEKVIEKIRSFL